MKTKVLILLAVVVTVFLSFNLNSINAQQTPHFSNSFTVDGKIDDGCKWLRIRCNKGGYIEGCLSIGDGTTCVCGQVTRQCPTGSPK